MDNTEALVKSHLLSRGFSTVIYEPDGNVPPDFLVDGEIAVEVRRLNQNNFAGPEPEGLEQVANSLSKKMQKLLTSFGPPIAAESWFVFYRFTRPVEPWKTLEPMLRSGLASFKEGLDKTPRILAVAQGFQMEIICRASTPRPTMFLIGGSSDEEAGGWTISEMEKNIRYCIAEKARKISKAPNQYSRWWLALVDCIGFGLDKIDQEAFRAQVSIGHSWEKVIVIDPSNHRRWFEI